MSKTKSTYPLFTNVMVHFKFFFYIISGYISLRQYSFQIISTVLVLEFTAAITFTWDYNKLVVTSSSLYLKKNDISPTRVLFKSGIDIGLIYINLSPKTSSYRIFLSFFSLYLKFDTSVAQNFSISI